MADPGEKRTCVVAKTPSEYLAKKSRLNPSTGCLEWVGDTNPKGYGPSHFNYTKGLAHRLAWETFCGPIPNGLCVLHSCDNPKCVNVRHLFLGTRQDNNRDCVEKKRHALGSRNRHAKLSECDVVTIKRMFDSGMSGRAIAREFQMSHDIANAIKRGATWRHVR